MRARQVGRFLRENPEVGVMVGLCAGLTLLGLVALAILIA